MKEKKQKIIRKNRGNPINTYMIEYFRLQNKLTIDEFCSSCDISVDDYDKLLYNDMDVDVVVIIKIAKRMNVEIIKILCPEK